MFKKADSKAGYMGALVFCIVSLLLAFGFVGQTLQPEQYHVALGGMLLMGFVAMLIFELLQRSSAFSKMVFDHQRIHLAGDRQHFLRSVFWRYLALLLPWCLMNLVIQQHYYFQTSAFALTRFAFEWIGWSVFLLGIPYIVLTLSLRGASKYEYNDYAVLTLLGCRALVFRIMGKSVQHHQHILKNRRSKKLLLSWLVTLFF